MTSPIELSTETRVIMKSKPSGPRAMARCRKMREISSAPWKQREAGIKANSEFRRKPMTKLEDQP